MGTGLENEGDNAHPPELGVPGATLIPIDVLPVEPPLTRLKSLYNASELAERPGRLPILITESDAAAQVAKDLIGKTYICLSIGAWSAKHRARPGPVKPEKYYDLTRLNDRDVLIWPTGDVDGHVIAAALGRVLYGHAKRVRFVLPDRTDGWDLSVAVREGWDSEKIITYARDHCRDVDAPPQPLKTIDDKRPKAQLVEHPDPVTQSCAVMWQELGLASDSKQVPYSTLSNASMIIQLHPEFKGKIWLDSFRGKVYHILDGAPAQWTDMHSRRLTAWIQQQMQLPKMSLLMIHDAVMHAAEQNQRHSLQDWLNDLVWDGIPRLDTWLADTLNLERNPYNDAIARNWPIAMVARAFKPGCKVDNMVVLEGVSGVSKTTFLEVLGDPWYKALPMAFGDKDFLQAIQGTWLVEIPDMTGFSRREHSHILATITIRTDSYRASYGRFVEDHPRVAVFAATSENDEYLADTRGKRRYWPLRCGDIDIDALRAQRSQIFAEALMEYRRGATWYKMPEGVEEEQLARATLDLWAERVLDEADALWGAPNPRITSSLLLQKIGLDLAKQDDAAKGRIARIMRANGWVQHRVTSARLWKKIARVKFDDEKGP